MERYCSTGQSPQRAVAPTEEEEEVVRFSSVITGSLSLPPYCNQCAESDVPSLGIPVWLSVGVTVTLNGSGTCT